MHTDITLGSKVEQSRSRELSEAIKAAESTNLQDPLIAISSLSKLLLSIHSAKECSLQKTAVLKAQDIWRNLLDIEAWQTDSRLSEEVKKSKLILNAAKADRFIIENGCESLLQSIFNAGFTDLDDAGDRGGKIIIAAMESPETVRFLLSKGAMAAYQKMSYSHPQIHYDPIGIYEITDSCTICSATRMKQMQAGYEHLKQEFDKTNASIFETFKILLDHIKSGEAAQVAKEKGYHDVQHIIKGQLGSAFVLAAFYGNKDACIMLKEAGVDTDYGIKLSDAKTLAKVDALTVVAHYGNKDMVQFLLESIGVAASPNAYKEAVRNGHKEVAELIAEKLQTTISPDQVYTLEYLRDLFETVDYSFNSKLKRAIEAVPDLLNLSWAVNVGTMASPSKYRNYAVDSSFKYQAFNLVNALMYKGSETDVIEILKSLPDIKRLLNRRPDLKDPMYGELLPSDMPLTLAARGCQIILVEKLIELGAEVNPVSGEHPLIAAANCMNYERLGYLCITVSHLLKAGANKSVTDQNGDTPFKILERRIKLLESAEDVDSAERHLEELRELSRLLRAT